MLAKFPRTAAFSAVRYSRAFTLIEVLSVLAILGLLAAMAMPVAELVAKRQKEQDLRLALREIRQAIDEYKRLADAGRIARRVGDSGYPRTLDELVVGVPDLAHPKGARIYLLRRIPRDPFAPFGVDGAASWAQRSYASPPDAPAEGDDVYDVLSRSDGVGLNGVPYRKW